ncbi:hypothetical protein P0Y35_01205 [Kiritimatiellaeota bacterium B1221]|nr:hypothetical protein [Kiritimatiellaeota bacterium B1221]
MKTISLLFVSCISLLLSAQVPEYKFEASYGMGYAGYSEDGGIRPVKSDWSGVAGDVFLEAQGKVGSTYAFLNARFTATETDTESWKENGVLVQENDMYMGGVDLNVGVAIPMQKSWGTFTPSLGFFAGFQSYTRENFVFVSGGDFVLGPKGEVTEDVESYGIGGGLALDFLLGEQWIWGAETSAYWMFYTYAENDAFDTGIEGDEGMNWESSLWIAMKLKNEGQVMGVKLTADLQMISGDTTAVAGSNTVAEWPDNDWEYYSLSLFWRGEF